jgi:hypothetical protein
MKSTTFFIALAALVLLLAGCRKNKINLTLDEIAGTWQRQPDDKPAYTGLQVDILSSQAIVKAGSGRGEFGDSTVKWRNISTLRDSVFFYEDLGSDGKYYDGQFTVSIRNGTWYIYAYVVQAGRAQGQAQTWVRN